MEKVSILIPVYNRESLILKTLNSVFNQSYGNIEVILYDDGSTDNSVNIIKESEYYNKIKLIECSENKGVGYARNILMSKSTGDYLCWLDSDDLFVDGRIQECINYIKEDNLDIVYTIIRVFQESNDEIKLGKKINLNTSKYNKNDFSSLRGNTTCASAFFKRKLKKYKFVEDLHLGSEDVLWLFTILQDNIKIGQLNKQLYLYRSHSDRIGVKKRKDENQDKKNIENKKISEYIKNLTV